MTDSTKPIPSKMIDGYTFELSPLPAWQALEVSASLMRFAGPLVAGAAAAKGDKGLDAFGTAINATLSAMPPAELVALAKRLLAPCVITRPDGSRAELMRVFDLEFQGRLLTVFKGLAFAVEVNYRDFFDALQGLEKVLRAKLRAAGLPIGPPAASS